MSDDMDLLYVHSDCCDEHWELVYHISAAKYELVCPRCGLNAQGLRVDGPVLERPDCHRCLDRARALVEGQEEYV